jgi:hypothetical protein
MENKPIITVPNVKLNNNGKPIITVPNNTNGKLTLVPSIKEKLKRALGLESYSFGSRIGSNSTNGMIFPILGTNNVLKVILMDTDTYNDYGGKSNFNAEVRTGRNFNINNIGTRIHKSTVFKLGDYYICAYTMTNLLSEDEIKKGYKAVSMTSFQKELYSRSFPNQEKLHKQIYSMLVNTLFTFYKKTKGWHGDLHSGNIYVILDSRGILIKMKIIDYGTHTNFKNTKSFENAKNLKDIFSIIKKETAKLPKLKKPPGFLLTEGRGQPVFPNHVILGNTKEYPALKRSLFKTFFGKF